MNKRSVMLAIPALIAVIAILGVVSAFYTDQVPPIITILGNNPATVQFGTSYVDAGAKARDMYGNDISSAIMVSNTVDTSIVGTYKVLYLVIDNNDNKATAIRLVNIVNSSNVSSTTQSNNSNVSVNQTTTPTPSTSSNANLFNVSPEATTATPVTGSAIETLTSPGGIIGIASLLIVIILAAIIIRARKKGKNQEIVDMAPPAQE